MILHIQIFFEIPHLLVIIMYVHLFLVTENKFVRTLLYAMNTS